jgi:hypothetical protein
MNNETKILIKDELLRSVVQTIYRVKATLEKERNDTSIGNPFTKRLLHDDIVIPAKFERSFSTSFGQRTIEMISRLIAISHNGTTEAENQKHTTFKMSEETMNSIGEHLKDLEEGKLGRKVCWKDDLKSIKKSKNKIKEYKIISDLWFKRDNIDYFFSIKTVKPNIDQTSIAKSHVLSLKLAYPKSRAFFALPYNPYGDKKNAYAHSPPFKIFNMVEDEVVLIGEEYWDLLGGKGTYNNLLELLEEAGEETKKLVLSMNLRVN